jgi:hypothetical protein
MTARFGAAYTLDWIICVSGNVGFKASKKSSIIISLRLHVFRLYILSYFSKKYGEFCKKKYIYTDMGEIWNKEITCLKIIFFLLIMIIYYLSSQASGK